MARWLTRRDLARLLSKIKKEKIWHTQVLYYLLKAGITKPDRTEIIQGRTVYFYNPDVIDKLKGVMAGKG